MSQDEKGARDFAVGVERLRAQRLAGAGFHFSEMRFLELAQLMAGCYGAGEASPPALGAEIAARVPTFTGKNLRMAAAIMFFAHLYGALASAGRRDLFESEAAAAWARATPSTEIVAIAAEILAAAPAAKAGRTPRGKA